METVQYVGYDLVEWAGTQKTQVAILLALKVNNDVKSLEYMQAYLRYLLRNPQIQLVDVTKVSTEGGSESNLYSVLES